MSGVTLGVLWGWGGDGGNAIVFNNGVKLHSSVNGSRDTGSLGLLLGVHTL